MLRLVGLAGASLTLVLLSGCAVGPDFEKPAAPGVSDYTANPRTATVATPSIAAGEAQRFVGGADISADWWTLFHSRPLNDLIEQALANNSDLKAARAALSVARENVLAQRGAYYPALSGSFSATRSKQSAALSPTPADNAAQYDLFTPELAISYAPDVFGLNQRTVESLRAQQEATRYQMVATYNTLVANVVVTAIQQASVDAQIDATRQLIDADTQMLQVLQYQFQKGYAGGLDLAAQKAQLAQMVATLPPLAKQQAQLHDLMAALTGQFPSQAPEQKFQLGDLKLPQDVPVSLPSALVAQRPDVLQAEENLHSASAQIGVAIANRLPNIQLTADAGSMALTFGQLFTPGSGFWDLGAAVAAPIFDGGTLLHRERGARAAFEQAAQQYRSTVLTAFQNVADSLVALDQDAEGLKAAADADAAAQTTLDLTQRQSKAGYANYLALLNAEQSYQQAHIALIQAQASRLADTAALFQALGGGWWHRADLNEAEK